MTSNRQAGFSLIVPVQDEEHTIESLLRSVSEQTRPPEEVILVDAGSVDDTVAKAQAPAWPFPLTIVKTRRAYPGVARNRGAAAARYDWLAFTDAGAILGRDWLREIATAAEAADAVLGSFDPVCDCPFKRMAAVAYVSERDHEGWRGPIGASMAVSRVAFDAVGGFPHFRAGEDLALAERLGERHVVRHAPAATVMWQMPRDAGSTFWRFAEYSWHNLAGGRWRSWHYGVGRLYVFLALAIAGAIAAGWGGLGWVAVPAFFVARAAKAAWRKRHSLPFETLRVSRVLGAAMVIALVDAATAFGSATWLLRVPARSYKDRDRLRRGERAAEPE